MRKMLSKTLLFFRSGKCAALVTQCETAKPISLSYCPQTKLWEGNVFTGICQSLGGRGMVSECGIPYPQPHGTDI